MITQKRLKLIRTQTKNIVNEDEDENTQDEGNHEDDDQDVTTIAAAKDADDSAIVTPTLELTLTPTQSDLVHSNRRRRRSPLRG